MWPSSTHIPRLSSSFYIPAVLVCLSPLPPDLGHWSPAAFKRVKSHLFKESISQPFEQRKWRGPASAVGLQHGPGVRASRLANTSLTSALPTGILGTYVTLSHSPTLPQHLLAHTQLSRWHGGVLHATAHMEVCLAVWQKLVCFSPAWAGQTYYFK